MALTKIEILALRDELKTVWGELDLLISPAALEATKDEEAEAVLLRCVAIYQGQGMSKSCTDTVYDVSKGEIAPYYERFVHYVKNALALIQGRKPYAGKLLEKAGWRDYAAAAYTEYAAVCNAPSKDAEALIDRLAAESADQKQTTIDADAENPAQ